MRPFVTDDLESYSDNNKDRDFEKIVKYSATSLISQMLNLPFIKKTQRMCQVYHKTPNMYLFYCTSLAFVCALWAISLGLVCNMIRGVVLVRL